MLSTNKSAETLHGLLVSLLELLKVQSSPPVTLLDCFWPRMKQTDEVPRVKVLRVCQAQQDCAEKQNDLDIYQFHNANIADI